MDRSRLVYNDPGILRAYDYSSVHTHTNVTSKKWWLGFCCAVLGILLLLYLPVYHQLQTRIGETLPGELVVGISGWNFNTSRDMRLYVLPDNTTSVLQPNGLCSSNFFLLIIVCSAVDNYESRIAIRKSWGSEMFINDVTVKIAFLIGQSENQTLQDHLYEENQQYEDIIQERFLDSYNNLTLKSVMLLKWVNNHCANSVKFIMKTDDDMYVNVLSLVTLLKTRLNSTKLLMGSLICGARPIADSKSKWYAPKYMYPGNVYPNYLSGTGYVMSNDVVKKLYNAALLTRLFHLEDVYITGMCARVAKIKPQNNPGFSYQRRKWDPCIYKDVATSHKVTPKEMITMHRILQNTTVLEHCEHEMLMTTPMTTVSDKRKNKKKRINFRKNMCS